MEVILQILLYIGSKISVILEDFFFKYPSTKNYLNSNRIFSTEIQQTIFNNDTLENIIK